MYKADEIAGFYWWKIWCKNKKYFQRKKFKESFYSSSRNLNKKNISLASCLSTPLGHVSCHMTHCKESHGWKKKKVFRNDPRRFKKVGLNSTFFLKRFDQFCSAHVNKWTVHVSKIFLENNRNRSEPLKKTGVDIRL